MECVVYSTWVIYVLSLHVEGVPSINTTNPASPTLIPDITYTCAVSVSTSWRGSVGNPTTQPPSVKSDTDLVMIKVGTTIAWH